MKIDIEKAKKEFLDYTNRYDLKNKKIKGKQEHSLRVMEISKEIAKWLKLSEEEIQLATIIGLLHDIGRFEQYAQYKTFRDLSSIDHGDYAVIILERDIRKYIETDQYDEVIKKAIKNHNKYKVEDNLNEKELLFAKIIRDADKLDIFYESVEIFWKNEEETVEQSKISETILNKFNERKQIEKSKGIRLEPIEDIVVVIAFIYDINFKISFKILKEADYINRILNRYNFIEKFSEEAIEEIRNAANKYIEEKTK